jgi:lipoprotein-anchoring transpeptidase ErfK/SrfK
MPLCVRHAIIGLAAVLATGLADPVGATRHRKAQPVETVAARPAGEPIMAIVSLSNQRVTIYDADGWILRAPVSSGQTGYETTPKAQITNKGQPRTLDCATVRQPTQSHKPVQRAIADA